MDPFLPIDFGDRPDAGDDDGEENCPNFGSSILFLAPYSALSDDQYVKQCYLRTLKKSLFHMCISD